MNTYFDLTFGLMGDGHFLCLLYGLFFLAMPVVLVLSVLSMVVPWLAQTLIGTRVLIALCAQLDRRTLWRVGDALCRVVPRRVALRHQSKAYHAALWLEAYEDHPTRADRKKAAHARLILSLPWV